MKIIISIIELSLFSSWYACMAQNELTEAYLKKQIPHDLIIDTVEQLNFDDDKEIETIITASDTTYSYTYEFWFKKDKLLKKITYLWTSINYKWLVNVDNDNLYEVVRAQGYEDGIDYAIYDITDAGSKPLFFFNPLLIDEKYPNHFFWGYPWDINFIIVNTKMQFLASLDYPIDREDDFSSVPDQEILPIIFFKGQTTQPEFKFDKYQIHRVFLSIDALLDKIIIEK